MIFVSDVLTTYHSQRFTYLFRVVSQYRKNPQKVFDIVVQPGDPTDYWGKVFHHKTERDSLQAGNAIKDFWRSIPEWLANIPEANSHVGQLSNKGGILLWWSSFINKKILFRFFSSISILKSLMKGSWLWNQAECTTELRVRECYASRYWN